MLFFVPSGGDSLPPGWKEELRHARSRDYKVYVGPGGVKAQSRKEAWRLYVAAAPDESSADVIAHLTSARSPSRPLSTTVSPRSLPSPELPEAAPAAVSPRRAAYDRASPVMPTPYFARVSTRRAPVARQ